MRVYGVVANEPCALCLQDPNARYSIFVCCPSNARKHLTGEDADCVPHPVWAQFLQRVRGGFLCGDLKHAFSNVSSHEHRVRSRKAHARSEQEDEQEDEQEETPAIARGPINHSYSRKGVPHAARARSWTESSPGKAPAQIVVLKQTCVVLTCQDSR